MNQYVYLLANFLMGGCLAMTLALPLGGRGWLGWFLATGFLILIVKLG